MALKRTLAEFVYIAGPKVLGGLLMLATYYTLLRFLQPADFGAFSLCVVTIQLVESMLGTPFDTAILRRAQAHIGRDEPRALTMEYWALTRKLAVALLLSLVAVVLMDVVARAFFGGSGHRSLIPLTCGAILTLLVLRSTLLHFQLRRRFAVYGMTEIFHIAVKFGAVVVVVVAFEPSPALLLGCFVVGPLAGAVLALGACDRRIWRRSNGLAGVQQELRKYTFWYMATVSIGVLIHKMDILWLGWQGSLEMVGLLSSAQVFALIPEMLGMYLSILLTPRIIPLCRDGKFRPFFVRVQIILVACAALAVLGLFALDDYIVHTLLPDNYQASAPLLFILVPGALVAFTTIPLALSFVLFVNKRFLVLVDCCIFPLVVAAYAWVTPRYGSLGVAWVTFGVGIFRSLIVQCAALYWIRTRALVTDAA